MKHQFMIRAVLLAAALTATSFAAQTENRMKQDFLKAVTQGDLAKVKELLKADPQLATAKNEQGVSAILLAASVWRCRMPSMRKRMASDLSWGSTWMSDARIRSASSNTVLSSLTTGASSAPGAEPSTEPNSTGMSAISWVSSLASPVISSVRR